MGISAFYKDNNLYIDFREYVNRIRYYEKKTISVSQNPQIKKDIYTDIFNSRRIFKIPKETTALANSPNYPNATPFTKQRGKGKPITRYAQGKIDEHGIEFDPYEKTKKGEHHYAGYVAKFYPAANINDKPKLVTQIVAKHIVEKVKK